jgi:protein SCO1/2
VTLLFFGYLSCPDVCPIQMAVLSEALDDLAADVRARIRVVFVTTDPARDSPEDMRQWLDTFDARFVGLTGTPEQLRAVQEAARVPVALTEPAADDGSYLVGHATQVLAFGPDGRAWLAYPFGVRRGDWARDLPRLVAGEHP